MAGYHAAVFVPCGAVEIDEDGNINIAVNEKKMTSEELAAIAVISEVLARLRNGKFIDYSFNIKSFENSTALVKCEWLRSGNLKIHGPTDRPYEHAESVDEAIQRHRTFTCSVSISALLPKRREYKAEGVSSGN